MSLSHSFRVVTEALAKMAMPNIGTFQPRQRNIFFGLRCAIFIFARTYTAIEPQTSRKRRIHALLRHRSKVRGTPTLIIKFYNGSTMFWTPELAQFLEDAPWPATKEELLDYANRTGAPQQVLDNLGELDDNEEQYENIEDLWPEYENETDSLFYSDDDDDDIY